jgi:hypothetical protein
MREIERHALVAGRRQINGQWSIVSVASRRHAWGTSGDRRRPAHLQEKLAGARGPSGGLTTAILQSILSIAGAR